MVLVGVVTTSIFVPRALSIYAANAHQHGHNIVVVITGDRGVDPAIIKESKEIMQEITDKYGYTAMYMTKEEQDEYLQSHPALHKELPWNCIQRRNVSILKAYELGCQVIITMDDDNLCIDGQDFIAEHCKYLLLQDNQAEDRGVRSELPVLESTSGWLNICEFLEDVNKVPYYPRGFPMQQRFQDTPTFTRVSHDPAESQRRIVVNGGLWLNDPDIDAMTRLANNIVAARYTREDNFALHSKTWCPFNSQNTALHRDVIPAYMVSWTVGRYDDIWPSYITRHISDHLGHSVSFGFPIVNQERNPHNYFVDLSKEVVGLEHTDKFCQLLRSCTLSKQSYHECYGELIPLFKAKIEADEYLANPKKESVKAFFLGFVHTMQVWHDTFKNLGA